MNSVTTRRRLSRAENQALTRQRLLEAGEGVFAERGFHGAPIEEIAERAGLSSGAFYSNFDSKAHLFLALMEKRTKETFAEISHILETNHEPADFFQAMRDRRAKRAVDPGWRMLSLEFVLFSMRNPEARVRLAERERYLRSLFARTIEAQHEILGVALAAPAEELGLLLRALDQGFDLQRDVDPDAVAKDEFINALELLSRALVALSLHPE